MTQRSSDYARYRIASARETLDEASILIEKRHARGSVNRLYYACFYAVEALLWTEGMESKRHSGVRSLFTQHWLKENRFPREMGEFYAQMLDSRNECDYAEREIKIEDIRSWFEQAQAFVEAVAVEVEKKLREDAEDA